MGVTRSYSSRPFLCTLAVTCDPPLPKMSLFPYFFDQMLWLLFITARFSAARLYYSRAATIRGQCLFCWEADG